MKRKVVIFLIVILALAAGFIYFTKDEVTFIKDSTVYKAVPVTSPAFFEFHSFKTIPFNNPIFAEIFNTENGNLFSGLIFQIDSLIKNSSEIQNGLRNESFILALGFTGKNDLTPLLIKTINTNSKKDDLEKLIELLYPQGQYKYQEKDYNGSKITAVSKDSNYILHYCFTERLFLFSSKAILVEQAIRQLNAYNILNDNYFTEVSKKVTSQSNFTLYINHENFPDLVSNWMNGKSLLNVNEFGEKERLNYKNQMDIFAHFASWTELGVKFNDDKISIKGVSVADDSLNHFLSVFNGQDAVNYNAYEVLPKNTSFYVSYSFSDKDKLFSNLDKYFSLIDSYYEREEKIKTIESGLRINFREGLKQIVKDEVVVATSIVPVNPSDKTTFFIISTEGEIIAEEQLNIWLSNYAERQGIDPKTLKNVYSINSETNFTVYKFPYPSLPGIWFGKPFTMAKAGFATFFKNFLIFSNSEQGIQEYLNDMVLGATLGNDIRYLQFKQNSTNRANMNIYVDVNRSFSFTRQLFNNDILGLIEKKEEVIRKFHAINWQVTYDKGLFLNSLVAKINTTEQEEAQATWQSNIRSSISFKPQILVNHRDPANREVIIQDEQNHLHQITNEGRIRWSIVIEEPILSEIFQIDYYKNGNLQYLFNTKNKLYLIDRNGNNVAHFPISFSSPASAGVNVFDYDNNRDYRYFISHENRKVLAYDYTGKIVNGWIFKQTDQLVTTPVKHFRVNRKDYIVFKDKNRIYILDRIGNTRVNISLVFENSANPLLLDLNGSPKIVATDISGKVYYLFFDGTYEEKKTERFSANHFFTCEDIDGNGEIDFVFVDGNKLKVMNENGKSLYSKKFENVISDPPNIYDFGSKYKMVGVVDATENRIYLFDKEGELYDGFPLIGSSQFSIGKLSESLESMNLLVGSEGGNLFNYTLN